MPAANSANTVGKAPSSIRKEEFESRGGRTEDDDDDDDEDHAEDEDDKEEVYGYPFNIFDLEARKTAFNERVFLDHYDPQVEGVVGIVTETTR